MERSVINSFLYRLTCDSRWRSFLASFDHLTHILKHDQAEHGNDRSLLFYGDAVYEDVLAPDGLGLVDFSLSRHCHNVHTGVFHDVGAVFSDTVGCIEAEKLGIGLISDA